MGRPQPADAELRLPHPPGAMRRWLAAHPRAVDRIIVGAYLFGCAAALVFDWITAIHVQVFIEIDMEAGTQILVRSSYLSWPWLLVIAAIVTLTAVALRFRRTHPLAGVVLVSVLLCFEQGLLALPNSVALFFLLFAVPVHRSVRAGWLAFGIAALVNLVIVQLTGGGGSGVLGPDGLAIAMGDFGIGERTTVGLVTTLWLLVVLMLGINVGNRQRYVGALIERVHQLAREREQRAQLAAVAERARIAREMHDVVAHSLSVVVTLSEAASVTAEAKPAAAKQAMQRAAETGRDALVEMRRLLGVLAEDSSGGMGGAGDPDGAARAPQPGVAQLSELVAGFAPAGLHVSFAESGIPVGDAQQQLAVYRIVQEGLTNSLRHAGPGSHVELTVLHTPEASTVEVIDSGPVDPGRVAGSAYRARIPGSGRGLNGARQRVRMFGGDIEHGPHGAGYRLFATVPVPRAGATGERE